MWPENDSEEPAWVKSERGQFSNYLDRNNDGFMDKDEIQQWIFPPDFDNKKVEAKHLISESDTDKVCIISPKRIVSE